MSWITLTAPDGKSVVYVSSDQIVRVRLPIGDAPNANAAVDFTNGQSQATHETVDQIMQKLRTQQKDDSA